MPAQIPTYSPYVSEIDVQLYARIAAYKQRLYDSRKTWIQDRVDHLNYLIKLLINTNNLSEEKWNLALVRKNMHKQIEDLCLAIGYEDYSDTSVFNKIQNLFDNIENNYYDHYNSLVRDSKK